jgi:hypothetical protein
MIALATTQHFFGWNFAGRTFDCGSKAGFFAANFAFAMARSDLVADLHRELAGHTRKDRAAASPIDVAVAPSLRDLRDIVARRIRHEQPNESVGEDQRMAQPRSRRLEAMT